MWSDIGYKIIYTTALLFLSLTSQKIFFVLFIFKNEADNGVNWLFMWTFVNILIKIKNKKYNMSSFNVESLIIFLFFYNSTLVEFNTYITNPMHYGVLYWIYNLLDMVYGQITHIAI